MKILILTILAFSLNACVPDISGDSNTYIDSYNTNNDSFNTYTQDQKDLIGDGYVPDEEGVCNTGYFWCSIEKKCLPAVDGSSCPVAHTDAEEAEADEINDSTN